MYIRTHTGKSRYLKFKNVILIFRAPQQRDVYTCWTCAQTSAEYNHTVRQLDHQTSPPVPKCFWMDRRGLLLASTGARHHYREQLRPRLTMCKIHMWKCHVGVFNHSKLQEINRWMDNPCTLHSVKYSIDAVWSSCLSQKNVFFFCFLPSSLFFFFSHTSSYHLFCSIFSLLQSHCLHDSPFPFQGSLCSRIISLLLFSSSALKAH